MSIESKDIKENSTSRADQLKQFLLPVRFSYGVILVRKNEDGQLQAIISCRRNTYAYDQFVLGRYNPRTGKAFVKQLFDKMTIEELLELSTLDFERIWWKFCLKKEKTEMYNKKSTKFSISWLSDGGKALLGMLNDAKPKGIIPHDIPKGRKEAGETNFDAAIREFKQETNIDLSNYVILEDNTRYSNHIDDGVKYVNYYYIGYLAKDVDTQMSLKRYSQLVEVRSVQWMNIDEIKKVDYSDHRLEKLVTPVFNLIKRRLSGKTRYDCKENKETPS